MSKRTRAPKRPIERVRSFLTNNITTAAGSKTLYTAEDSVTLIRTIIQGTFYAAVTHDTPTSGYMVLEVRPRGQTVVELGSVAEDLGNVTPIEEILRFPYTVERNTTIGFSHYVDVDLDVAAMRKLRSGDTLVCTFLSDSATASKFTGIVQMWFKE